MPLEGGGGAGHMQVGQVGYCVVKAEGWRDSARAGKLRKGKHGRRAWRLSRGRHGVVRAQGG